ncbi:type II toxin-antitoxin system RelE/ParE family toxin [Fibrella aquatica]|uniref:type II toxin-antitoxin system RelE/ParE family toxin n=1 Tax=Fibrella aquatica TaxID=3242487 RepID=UPI00352227C0
MSYDILTSENFVKELKRLAKKYPSLKQDVEVLGESLAENPEQGSPLGRNCYKIRLAIKSKGRGKRGGARVISCVVALQESVTLLSIFDKADQATISDQEIERLLIENDLA